MAEKMYMYEYMICICMRIQILGKHIKYPLIDPWKFNIYQLIKTNHASIVIVQKHLNKQLLNRPLDNPKHSTITKSNVKYVSTREHHNAQCQTPYKGERGEMEKSVVVCFDDI